MKVYYWLMNLLFPDKCLLCRALLKPEETDLCTDCRCHGPRWERSKRKIQFLDSVSAVWYYEENVRASLLRYKFGGARSYAKGYGRFLAMSIDRNCPEGFDVLTWIPVSPLRRLRRGYDQVELLARAVAKELGVDCVPVLKKIRHNPQQSKLRDEALRRANVLGVYRVTDIDAVRGKRVMLLDDILTTGATAGEAARMLKTAGAVQVHCAAVAASRKL